LAATDLALGLAALLGFGVEVAVVESFSDMCNAFRFWRKLWAGLTIWRLQASIAILFAASNLFSFYRRI
jgi:hypothetical protein